VAEYRMHLARTAVYYGMSLQTVKKLHEALVEYTEAVAESLQALKGDARSPAVRSALINASLPRAMLLCGLKRVRDSIGDWDRVVSMIPAGKERDAVREQRALALALGGEAIRAIVEAIDLSRKPDLEPTTGFNLVGVAAVSSVTVLADERR